ncbi:D-inositol-3-phosphate glycosyltransferase [Vibrio stylophorae]|uniref:D-inositol-3-phosphate glycosyltransferase n=1 Tax=Vibrio stylophorae TaxID=659351 RepID=A0ABN8DWA9_9VIBR|nr:glycosyltransferase [Vibrio stylophorae]CAH0534281.1 D-inositol-3-phosphate glycosyltransferase [Vibrio stylophorae]
MTIYLFSTRLGNGRGGISTALLGYVSSLENKVNIRLCETHSFDGKLKSFFLAVKNALQVKQGDYCWFHVGSWFSMVRKLFIIFICKAKGGRIITHFHSQNTIRYIKHPVLGKVISLLVILSEKVVVLTPWWKQVFESNGFTSNLIVSPNPLDENLSYAACECSKRKNESNSEVASNVRILSMSRLEKGKGFDRVILALKILPDYYTLQIAGDGSELEFLKELVLQHQLQSRVQFLGWVDYDKKIELLKNNDLFCLPSKFDSFGMVYIEAMAVNLPVVALNYQAIPDVVPGEFGVLCDDDEPQTLADAIIAASHKRNKNSASFVLATYSAEKITDDFLREINYDR